MKIEASAPLPLPLLPGWWDAAPGSPPARAAYLCVAPGARVRCAPGDPCPAEADIPEAVARMGALDMVSVPVGGPLRIGERAAERLARARGAPGPWADAAAAVRGGLVRLIPGEDGRPRSATATGTSERKAIAAVWKGLRDRLVAWRLPRPAPPGWARRAAALAWLGETGPRKAWDDWAESAQSADAALDGAETQADLADALGRVWEALSFLHEREEAARNAVAGAMNAGADAALVDDGGRFALALARSAGFEDRLRQAGITTFLPRPAPLGLVLRVKPSAGSASSRHH